jgi:hypothetical protein
VEAFYRQTNCHRTEIHIQKLKVGKVPQPDHRFYTLLPFSWATALVVLLPALTPFREYQQFY